MSPPLIQASKYHRKKEVHLLPSSTNQYLSDINIGLLAKTCSRFWYQVSTVLYLMIMVNQHVLCLFIWLLQSNVSLLPWWTKTD